MSLKIHHTMITILRDTANSPNPKVRPCFDTVKLVSLLHFANRDVSDKHVRYSPQRAGECLSILLSHNYHNSLIIVQ